MSWGQNQPLPSHLRQEIPPSRGKYPRSEALAASRHHFLPLPDILGDILHYPSSHYVVFTAEWRILDVLALISPSLEQEKNHPGLGSGEDCSSSRAPGMGGLPLGGISNQMKSSLGAPWIQELFPLIQELFPEFRSFSSGSRTFSLGSRMFFLGIQNLFSGIQEFLPWIQELFLWIQEFLHWIQELWSLPSDSGQCQVST